MSTMKRIDSEHIQYETEFIGSYSIYLNNEKLAESDQKKIWIPVNPHAHPVYEVHRGKTIEYVREQLMDKTGVVNFRDIGGYYTMDGRQVRHGIFYRSAPLISLNPSQKAYLDDLQIKTILDLRSAMEITGNEDYIPQGAAYVHASGIQDMEADTMNGNFDFSQLMKQADVHMLKGFIERVYRELPIQNPAYHTLMNLIMEEETPIVFHCSAGKDRTGFAAALILLTLGVDMDDVMRDYLLSNELRKAANNEVFQSVQKEQQAMEALMLVYPQYLQLSFQRIQDVYGSFENYLLQEYGIDETKRNVLKRRYLYAG